VINSALLRRPPRCTKRLMTIIWMISTAGGLAWAAGMQSLDHAGAYRGMVPFTSSLSFRPSHRCVLGLSITVLLLY
jgi:hypothetical protein